MTHLVRIKPPLLELEHLSVNLGSKVVIHDLSAQIGSPKWVSVIGTNGAGKSTLLKALASLIPFEGNIRLNGVPIRSIKPQERARLVSWMGQTEPRLSGLKVRDVVMLSRYPHQGRTHLNSNFSDQEEVTRALDRLRVLELQDQVFTRLSGGEQQRVLIARAMAVRAPLLLLDEPFAFLDPPHQAELAITLREEVAQGQCVITVIHDLNLALQTDWICLLKKGRVFFEGPSSDPQTHQAMEAAFDHRVKVIHTQDGWVCKTQ
jgi:iron complex transport system ATP-binding protein